MSRGGRLRGAHSALLLLDQQVASSLLCAQLASHAKLEGFLSVDSRLRPTVDLATNDQGTWPLPAFAVADAVHIGIWSFLLFRDSL